MLLIMTPPYRKSNLYYKGWPNSISKLDTDLKQFWNIRNQLYVEGPLLYFKNRLVFPSGLRTQVLQLLQEGH